MNLEVRKPEPVEPIVAEDNSGTPLNPDLVHVAQSLHRQYDQRLGSELVESEIRHTASEFTNAPLRTFVPLLVRRYTGEALKADCLGTDRATGGGR